MAAIPAKIRAYAKQLVELSLVDGCVSAERVSGVLASLEKNPPLKLSLTLQAYRKLILIEIAKGEARVEHAGPVAADALAAIAASLGKRYGRPVTTVSSSNPALFAGLRVRIGDDIYESSVASQLGALSAAS
ncbi:ATP synthase F0F1 subunit delta [Verrucomicrobia bacterium IMCC26134]|jgi:F-type H+-transporting ATPase subunit delta|nr:ATP synthase F0F1 subunit delta [Verrucomicrobia bacterium IMCC26134]